MNIYLTLNILLGLLTRYILNAVPSRLPIMKNNIMRVFETKWRKAKILAHLEQSVEDFNSLLSNSDSYSRHLIVLPLDERFNPPKGGFGHGHVQTGDKMSLPKEFATAIRQTQADAPWLFVVSPKREQINENILQKDLPDSVMGGVLDFRAPSNYVFLPSWMIRFLHIKPLTVVDITLNKNSPSASAVTFFPHSKKFTKLKNHKALLETELRYYSALTKGSIIPFDFNGRRYYFGVVDIRNSKRREKVDMAQVQDCDLAAEFVLNKR